MITSISDNHFVYFFIIYIFFASFHSTIPFPFHFNELKLFPSISVHLVSPLATFFLLT